MPNDTTSYAFEREHVGTVLAEAWTDCPINWPNDELAEFPVNSEGKPALPVPTGDRTNPARWLGLEFDYDSVLLQSFDGDVRCDGVIIIAIHVERGAGDGKLRQMLDELVEIFHGADTDGLQFMEPEPDLPDYDHEPWYRRQVFIPFVRFQNL